MEGNSDALTLRTPHGALCAHVSLKRARCIYRSFSALSQQSSLRYMAAEMPLLPSMATEELPSNSRLNRYDGGLYDEVETLAVLWAPNLNSHVARSTGDGRGPNRARSRKRRCSDPEQQIPHGAIRQGVLGRTHQFYWQFRHSSDYVRCYR